MSPVSASQANTGLRTSLKDVLGQIAHAEDFDRAARDLLEVLGYPTAKTMAGQTGNVNDFLNRHTPLPGFKPGTKSEQKLRDENPVIKLLCQVTNESLDLAGQHALLEQPDIDVILHHSFLFVTVDLGGECTYRRADYAQHTREINKRFLMPTVVLYRTNRLQLTVAFVKRRQDKHDERRDVLEKVSLIRDIDLQEPHPGHLRLVEQLSIADRRDWMRKHVQPPNFDGLLRAWVDTLNTDTLNKEFYRRLFDWFQRAVDEATFPTGDTETRQEEQVIRLITRLLFIWFMKEKGLVAPELFIENQAKALLRGYDPEDGDTYYPAILHNLFFATLNTEYDDQAESRRRPDHYLHTEMIDDLDGLISLFDKTPFINGGLFDRLDPDDYYSPDPEHQRRLSVPNRLFFDPAGIITLLDSYKFTLEENTPIDQEVALDPELLGRVFENLLAAHIPETRTTVRKRTGSYYTPRPVVDYMVDEALVASLVTTCAGDRSDGQVTEEMLRQLFHHGHETKAENLSDDAKQSIVSAIANIKILDPAVGSGAFPMAVLSKLTLALRRLDPDNQLWKARQRQIATKRAAEAFREDDQATRDERLHVISDTFEKYRNDFGRKLYLIQNSIYGVDILPIACQIAKLRCFITLALDQTPKQTAKNRGIRPLPNLETKFVAADTLIGLEGQQALTPPPVEELLRRLDINREQHFLAAIPQHKHALREEHRALRTALADALADCGMPSEHTQRIATWDPYDPNTPANWFVPNYMFGVSDGFDVVLGNPPYIELRKESGRLSKRYKPVGYTSFSGHGDIYYLFYERGTTLLKPNEGVLAYITSNSWMKAKYASDLRGYLTEHTTPIQLLDMGKDVFDATVSTNILILQNGRRHAEPFPAIGMDTPHPDTFPPHPKHWDTIQPSHKEVPWVILSPPEEQVVHQMREQGTPLAQWGLVIRMGIKTGYNTAFIIEQEVRDRLISEDQRSDEIITPMLRGKDIQRYRAESALYLISTHNGYGSVPAVNPDDYPAVKRHLQNHYSSLASRSDQGRTPYNLRSIAHWNLYAGEKLFIMDMAQHARVTYSETVTYCGDKAYILAGHSIKYLCALLNSSLVSWWMSKNALTTGAGAHQWKMFIVKRIPIPSISSREQQPFIQHVDDILSAKDADPQADTRRQEAEVDQMVYQLYGLSDKQITVVARSTRI